MSNTEKPIHAPEPPPAPPSFTEVLESIVKDKSSTIEGKLFKMSELSTIIAIMQLDLLQQLLDRTPYPGVPPSAQLHTKTKANERR